MFYMFVIFQPQVMQQFGPIALAKNIVKTEGPKGLYRGIAPNFMKVTQSINVFISVHFALFYNLQSSLKM